MLMPVAKLYPGTLLGTGYVTRETQNLHPTKHVCAGFLFRFFVFLFLFFWECVLQL